MWALVKAVMVLAMAVCCYAFWALQKCACVCEVPVTQRCVRRQVKARCKCHKQVSRDLSRL